MAKKQTSAKKRTAKVVSPTPSITSSTTGKPVKSRRKTVNKKTEPPETESTSTQISPEIQDELCSMLQRGASPFGACQQLEISLESVKETYVSDRHFSKQIDQVPNVLSQNVAAALYRQAMEGNVSAQIYWLKTLPPPGWSQAATSPVPLTFDETLDQLSDEELIELARAMGVDLSPQNITNNGEAPHANLTTGVP